MSVPEIKCKCQAEAPIAENPSEKPSSALWISGTILSLCIWVLLYSQLVPFSKWIVAQLPIEQTGHFYESLVFFFYDTPKVLLLLTLVIFLMGIVRSFFSPERTRALLAGKNEGIGNIAAACLGIVTPFCSCSAVPLFVGFVSAGVPLGVTFSFLIAAPMVNEVALVLLFGLVGWKIALAYLVFGLGLAIIGGWVIGRFHLESWLEDWVRNVR
ncbi:MAG: permease, partial [Alphaproteobacteria bacterium]|nr:permease [Alphaproteobacteria bacterium]